MNLLFGERHHSDVPHHRSNFKLLLLSNPNYFGTFPALGGEVVEALSFDTAFEELTCLGLNPEQNHLEAVVNIKQHNGYGTNACDVGTLEYVRFFVQHPDGGWHDLGSTSFNVYDLASSPLPLSYAASINFDEARKFCFAENILNVRAILSWNLEPPAGDPNFAPPWGNVLNARVQVAPELFYEIPIADLIAANVLKLDDEAVKVVDVTQKLPAKPEKPLSFGDLKAHYANTQVPAHRYGFVEANKLLKKHSLNDVLASAAAESTQTEALKQATLVAGPDLAAIIAAIYNPTGDTFYEELLCAGYNPQTRELEAVIQIKENAGYSGGLCTAGSAEYVSFFAFIGGVWQALGTATVSVHDLAAVSADNPLMYAVYRITNLSEMACQDLTGIPLRAILSWQVQATGPDFIPVWGNVIDTHVQPQIGQVEEGNHIRLMRLGSVSVNGFSNTTTPPYLANPTNIAGDCTNAHDSPLAGEIIVEGDFTPKIDVFDHTTGVVLPGAKPYIYQVWVTPEGGSPSQLTNGFGIGLYPPDAPFPPVVFSQSVKPAPGPVIGGAAGDVYYQYMESNLQAVNPRTLAAFEAGGLSEGQYTVEVRGWQWDGANYVPMTTQSQTIYVYNGYPHLENGSTVYRPQVAIGLSSVVDCGDVVVGDTLTGYFSVVDHFFNAATIALVPITVGGIAVYEPGIALFSDPAMTLPLPNPVVFDGTNTTGVSGYFRLETNDMTPCGYTIELTATDRALADSHCWNHWNQIGVGFCLRAK